MENLNNAVITKDLLQNVVENRLYNETIIKYYNQYRIDLEKNLKLYKDLNYLIECLIFTLHDNYLNGNKVDAYTKSIIAMANNLNFDLENRSLINSNDIEYLSSKCKKIIDDLEVNLIRTILNKTDNLDNCNKYWDIDKFIQHKQKWVKRQNLCHDKFCSNCKKVKQAARMEKYIPVLESYQNKLYHLTLTIPNVEGKDLNKTIKKMSKCFKSIINYLTGHNKIKGIDFSPWRYEGAVRSLEVTYNNNKSLSYHPHFHVGLVMDPISWGKKNITNTYSYDFRKAVPELKRLFNNQEILIQKIWYLLINNVKVTKKNIEQLEEGYSCIIDKFPSDDYAELFKYMTKDKDEDGNILTYDNFRALYEGLYRIKQIQGYGVLYKINDTLDLEKYEEKYKSYIEELIKKESPVEVRETPQELILDSKYKLLNKKSYIKYLKEL